MVSKDDRQRIRGANVVNVVYKEKCIVYKGRRRRVHWVKENSVNTV